MLTEYPSAGHIVLSRHIPTPFHSSPSFPPFFRRIVLQLEKVADFLARRGEREKGVKVMASLPPPTPATGRTTDVKARKEGVRRRLRWSRGKGKGKGKIFEKFLHNSSTYPRNL